MLQIFCCCALLCHLKLHAIVSAHTLIHTHALYYLLSGTGTWFNHATFVWYTLQFFILNIELLTTTICFKRYTQNLVAHSIIPHLLFFAISSKRVWVQVGVQMKARAKECLRLLVNILLEHHCFYIFSCLRLYSPFPNS